MVSKYKRERKNPDIQRMHSFTNEYYAKHLTLKKNLNHLQSDVCMRDNIAY